MVDIAKGHRKRLKERWLEAGLSGFNDRDLLELLLTFAIPQKDTKPLAVELLEHHGSLDAVLAQDPYGLMSHAGVGEHVAVLLSLVHGLRRRSSQGLKGTTVTGPQDVQDVLLRDLGFQPEERFLLLLLNQKNVVLDMVTLEIGIENRAHVYIKKMAKVILARHATGVIFVHNHPSGTGDFSAEDIALTKRCDEVLKALEVRLLDHFLVAGDQLLSMRESGLFFK